MVVNCESPRHHAGPSEELILGGVRRAMLKNAECNFLNDVLARDLRPAEAVEAK